MKNLILIPILIIYSFGVSAQQLSFKYIEAKKYTKLSSKVEIKNGEFKIAFNPMAVSFYSKETGLISFAVKNNGFFATTDSNGYIHLIYISAQTFAVKNGIQTHYGPEYFYVEICLCGNKKTVDIQYPEVEGGLAYDFEAKEITYH